ncbi:MAG: glycosyltransferase, partial [Planctomycetota bacterium]
NAAGTIAEAVESVLGQAGTDFEHVVVDGGSTDGTLDVLGRYLHLRVVGDPGGGQSHSMNLGFEASSGEIISYLNADDAYEPGAFAEVQRCFSEKPEMKFLVGGLRLFQEGQAERISAGNIVLEKMLRYFDRDFIPMNPACYFYCREVQEAAGPFDPDLPYTMDYKFLLEAAVRFPFDRTEKVLGRCRLHADTKTGRTSSVKETWRKARFSTAYYRHLPWPRRLLARLWYVTEGHWLGQKLVGKAAWKIRKLLGG